jgi:hypothetical protein
VKHVIAIALLAACGAPAANQPAPVKPGAPAALAGPPPVPQHLTTAEQVIEASLAQEGGRGVAEKNTSLHMTGKATISALGVNGTLDTWSAPPNLSVTHFEIPNMITDDEGVKGDLAWEKNTLQGARILSGAEKSMALREAIFNGDLQWKTLYPKAELKGVVKFAEQDCYQVVLTATDGQAQTRYYTTKELLPIGLEMVAPSQMGDVAVKVVSSDWRDEGGFKFPHKVSRLEGPQTIEITMDKVETNVPIPPGKFEPPDEIKQLAAQPAK